MCKKLGDNDLLTLCLPGEDLRTSSLRLKFWENYRLVRDHGETPLDQSIEICRKDPSLYSPHFAAWVKLIDMSQSIPDLCDRAQFINGWVNSMISYDHDKRSDHTKFRRSLSDVNKFSDFQTPLTTLNLGHGICGDTAMLKYETLKRCGFSVSEIALVIVEVENTNTHTKSHHMITSVTANSQSFLLDNQRKPLIPNDCDLKSADPEKIIDAFRYNAALVTQPVSFQKGLAIKDPFLETYRALYWFNDEKFSKVVCTEPKTQAQDSSAFIFYANSANQTDLFRVILLDYLKINIAAKDGQVPAEAGPVRPQAASPSEIPKPPIN